MFELVGLGCDLQARGKKEIFICLAEEKEEEERTSKETPHLFFFFLQKLQCVRRRERVININTIFIREREREREWEEKEGKKESLAGAKRD